MYSCILGFLISVLLVPRSPHLLALGVLIQNKIHLFLLCMYSHSD